jgi:predicted enzyme related to lactoylglutathione lyase
MPVVTRHAPGTFCWPELATTDAHAAARFYGALFGWSTRQTPLDEGVYTMFLVEGRDAAAMMELPTAMREKGVPVHWAVYVAVEDTDAAADRARGAGGQVIAGPFDVLDAGRMAVVADPLGATFCLWQPRQHAGVGVLNEPGALGWTQLNARDPARAKEFYGQVLGWSHADAPMGEGVTYTTWLKSDGAAGGMMPMPAGVPATAPSHWLTYFVVPEVEAAHTRALSLGATSFVPPSQIPGGGRFAVVADPQGAVFGLMTAM